MVERHFSPVHKSQIHLPFKSGFLFFLALETCLYVGVVVTFVLFNMPTSCWRLGQYDLKSDWVRLPSRAGFMSHPNGRLSLDVPSLCVTGKWGSLRHERAALHSRLSYLLYCFLPRTALCQPDQRKNASLYPRSTFPTRANRVCTRGSCHGNCLFSW